MHVTLESLLSLFAILIAILAIARPVQRRSILLFGRPRLVSSAILIALALIVCRDAPFGVRPPFGWSLPVVIFGLTIGAFVIPVVAAIIGWMSWNTAHLSPGRSARMEEILQAALREREFDEVERILRKNTERLTNMPVGAASVLFNPMMVSALFESHSLVPLELLANLPFVKSLPNRFGRSTRLLGFFSGGCISVTFGSRKEIWRHRRTCRFSA